jgi:hypothetical protein
MSTRFGIETAFFEGRKITGMTVEVTTTVTEMYAAGSCGCHEVVKYLMAGGTVFLMDEEGNAHEAEGEKPEWTDL